MTATPFPISLLESDVQRGAHLFVNDRGVRWRLDDISAVHRDATLILQAPSAAPEHLTLADLPAVAVSSDTGAVVPDDAGVYALTEGAAWLEIVWQGPVAVRACTLTGVIPDPATGITVRLALYGGRDQPAAHQTVDTAIAIGDGETVVDCAVAIPAVLVEKVVIEFLQRQDGDPANVFQPAAVTAIDSIEMQIGAVARDLSVAIAPRAPFWRHGEPLPDGETVVDDFPAALDRARGAGANEVELVLRAGTAGLIDGVRAERILLQTLTTFAGGEDTWQAAVTTTAPTATVLVPGSAGREVVSLALDLRSEGTALTLLADYPPDIASDQRYQLCDSDHALAQAVSPIDTGPLHSIDLWLVVGDDGVDATLAIHGDAGSRPNAEPEAGQVVDVALTAVPGRAPRLISIDLPAGIERTSAWWWVLTVSRGSCLVPLVPPGEGTLAGKLRQRRGRSDWAPLGHGEDVVASSRLWAVALGPPPSPTLSVTRGDAEAVPLSVSDDDGHRHVLVDPIPLNAPGVRAETLFLQLAATAPVTITAADLALVVVAEGA